MPTTAHVIYIPAMLMLGIVLGYIFGSRAARDAMLAEQARKEARAARRARADQAKSPSAPLKDEPASDDASDAASSP